MRLINILKEEFSSGIFELIRQYQDKFDLDYNEENMTISISYITDQQKDVSSFIKDAKLLKDRFKVIKFDKANMKIELKVV